MTCKIIRSRSSSLGNSMKKNLTLVGSAISRTVVKGNKTNPQVTREIVIAVATCATSSVYIILSESRCDAIIS